jgi:hypothetical protein
MKSSFLFLKISLILPFFILQNQGNSNNIPSIEDDLRIFSFHSEKTGVLPGLSTENANGYNCNGKILDEDKIGDIAIVALFYQNGCYTDGQYNHNSYKIETGKVTDSKNEFSFDAYKIYEPTKKATKFLASKHCISYKFKDKQDYTIYQLTDGKIDKVTEILAKNITPGSYNLIKELSISEINGSEIYFFAPSKTRLSMYNQYSKTVEGALVNSTSIANIYKYRYQSGYVPFDQTINRYTNTRQFFLLKTSYGKINAIWQDEESKSILLTQFSKDLKSESTIKLPNNSDAQLVAATNDPNDNYYYLVIEDRSKKSGTDVAVLYKVSKNGYLIKKSEPDVSKSGLNIYHFGNYMADLQYLNGTLGLFIARTMFASSDGLNHQGGIAVVFDTNTLSVIRNFGQTSGHSFDNYLTINSNNEFLGIDLGDNYPRGINLHKFSDKQIRSKVIYTFKTEHGQRAASPAGKTYPFYSEISTSNKKYYKWSNDNGTYTSLGALIEVDDGYVVLFTGEPDANGKSINNSRVGKNNTDSRNVGFLKIVKDFETKSGKGNVVSDDMVVSKGVSETGGFYTFGGWFAEQRNTGVQWLTKYKKRSQETAIHLKAVKLSDGNILLLWEKMKEEGYNKNYQSTVAMKIDKNGRKISEEIDLGSHVRLTRRDEPLLLENKIIIAGGNKAEKKLELVVIELK